MQENPCGLEDVIATELLDQRKPRTPDVEGETSAKAALIQDLAKAPEGLFQKLVNAILDCSNADSAGVSLLDRDQQKFVWPAVVGGLSSYIGAGTPMDFGPCGTVLDRKKPLLFVHPERYFTYLVPIAPPLEEVLLVPFHVDGEPVGTVWAVIHEPNKHFDSEDRRLLENLSDFAATAYHVLTETGALKTLLSNLPPPHLQPLRPITNEGGQWRFLGKK